MCIPYHTHLFIKKVYTLLYIQNHSALPIFPLPAAMCTHMHMHFISKKCTPYHTYQFAGSSQEKKTKHSFAGRLSAATTLRGAHCGMQEQRPCTAPILPLPTPCTQFAGHTPRCRAQAPPAGHTHPLSRSQKQKRCKNTGNTRCIKKKNMKKEIKMNKYRKKNQKNKRK